MSRSVVHFELISVYGIRTQIYFFAYGWPVLSATFVRKTVFPLLNYLGTFVKSRLTVNIRVYFWTLKCVTQICKSFLMPVPHCFEYYSFMVNFETG